MFPFLTYPLALIALASLPALAAIYILRNRFRRRQVSSLMLWRFHVQSREGGSRVNRLQLPLLFFLELLALALLVTAAAGPHWRLPQSTRPLIVVLDDSLSMRAVTDGVSARDRARESLQRMFRFQAPPSTRLILAGRDARLVGVNARTWSEVEQALAQWQCWAPGAAIESALTLAGEVGKQQANILVLTDQRPPDENIANDRLQWRAFGVPSRNVAIINAARTANGDQDRCLLEIANYSRAPKDAVLRVLTSSNGVPGRAQETRLSMAPHESQRVVFNIPGSAASLEIRLDAGQEGGLPDSLVEDNRVQLLAPIRKRVRVQVALTNSEFADLVNRTLEATGLRAAISANPDLVIHHSDFAGSNAWSLNVQSPAEATAFAGPFVIDTSHPLAQGLALNGAIWAAGGSFTNSAEFMPVVLAGNVPLLSVREDMLGRQFMRLNLDPQLSTWTRMPDWPVLLYNLLDWRAAQLPGLRENNGRLGSEVVLQTTSERVTVRWPDGTVKSFQGANAALALESPLPGLYTVTMGSMTNSFAVNPLAAGESNLQNVSGGQWGDWKTGVERQYEQSPLAWLFGLAALGILTAHLCLVARGRAGG